MARSKQQITYTHSMPAAAQEALTQLGRNIAAARLRRRWRQADLAAKAGITRATVIAIEHGRAGTGIGAYVGVLWALGLHGDVAQLAAPQRDVEGATLEAARLGTRARPPATLNDEF
ncbi:MAG TPA: helix-turn-helix domain-containing protein [Longimicrobium sp.]|nr:helix-turn-helix domain-containing protein [Longimicrobium sp.]